MDLKVLGVLAIITAVSVNEFFDFIDDYFYQSVGLVMIVALLYFRKRDQKAGLNSNLWNKLNNMIILVFGLFLICFQFVSEIF